MNQKVEFDNEKCLIKNKSNSTKFLYKDMTSINLNQRLLKKMNLKNIGH